MAERGVLTVGTCVGAIRKAVSVASTGKISRPLFAAVMVDRVGLLCADNEEL